MEVDQEDIQSVDEMDQKMDQQEIQVEDELDQAEIKLEVNHKLT